MLENATIAERKSALSDLRYITQNGFQFGEKKLTPFKMMHARLTIETANPREAAMRLLMMNFTGDLLIGVGALHGHTKRG